MSADREMIADLLSALEFHQQQTRPIAMTRTAIVAAQHHLRSAAPAAPAAEPVALTDEQIDAATSTARDSLLDHIDEYGISAEGTMRRVRRVARAAIAEFCRVNGIGAPHD